MSGSQSCCLHQPERSVGDQEFEDSHPVGGGASEEEGGKLRLEAVGRLVALGRSLSLHEECIHDSVQLLDRLAALGLGRDAALAPAVLGAVALISAKQGVRAAPCDCLRSSDTHVLSP